MALEIMKENVQIIQSLSDYPNQEEGLTAGEMKAKFDEAAMRLQSYINGSIVPAVNDKLSASEMSGAVSNAVEQALNSITPDKIGAAPADHVTNKNNPHGVTAAQVGAAPAGFGLGGTPVAAPNDSLDEAIANGWYNCSDTTAGGPTGLKNIAYGTVLVVRRYGQNVTQLYVSQPGTSVGAPYLLVRNCSNYSAWNPWEWINPPLASGVEYRTVERFTGKPVYVKMVDCLGMPAGANATKSVEHNATNIESIVSFGGNMSVGGANSIALPYYFSETNLAHISVDYQQVRIANGNTDLSGYTNAKVWFKYTKTTD